MTNKCPKCGAFMPREDALCICLNLNKGSAIAMLASIDDPNNNNVLEDNMNKKTIPLKTIVIITLIMVCFSYVAWSISRNNVEIIAINNWAHGILLCNDKAAMLEGPINTLSSLNKNKPSSFWEDKYGTWTVTTDHLEDPEFDVLKAVAEFTCPYNAEGFFWERTHNHIITNDGDDIKLHAVQFAFATDGSQVTDKEELDEHMIECDHNFTLILAKVVLPKEL